MYLTVDSLIEIHNRITGSNNITLRKVKIKPYGFNEMHIDKELMEDINSMKEKLLLQSITQYSSTNYIHFMIEVAEHVRYCLLMMI